jgi:DNA-binding XRE family transcriptional regulator
MPESPLDVAPSAVGSRIATARHKSGLTQRQLADALGTSLWTVDRIEAGTVNPKGHLSTIAEVTSTNRDWLLHPNSLKVEAKRPRTEPADVVHLGSAGRSLVLGSIVVLVTIRFFTEVVPVVPRAANFVDIPIFLALATASLALPPLGNRGRTAYLHLGGPALAFFLLAMASALVNSSRAAPAPVLVFVYGFLAPIVVYASAYRIWPPGNSRPLSRVLVALGLVQLVVVALIGIPRFLATSNPDYISGTFGTNQYQLVFFLLVVATLLAGIFALEPGRAIARVAPLVILAFIVVMLLAQYRALLFTMLVTMVVVAALLGRHLRGALVSALAIVGFVLIFSFVASNYPVLSLNSTATTLTENPRVYAAERYDATLPVRRLYRDRPYVAGLGTGPGTFSSRAWQTFSQAGSTSHSNVQGGYAQRLTGGIYTTDVSDQYVVSQVNEGGIIEGSAALSKPYSSYLGLMAEVGIFGLVIILAMYIVVLFRAGILARTEIATAARAGDSVPALALATTVGFLTLLQMGLLENWLEVTRITFIVWLMLAVVAKEIDFRRGSGL